MRLNDQRIIESDSDSSEDEGGPENAALAAGSKGSGRPRSKQAKLNLSALMKPSPKKPKSQAPATGTKAPPDARPARVVGITRADAAANDGIAPAGKQQDRGTSTPSPTVHDGEETPSKRPLITTADNAPTPEAVEDKAVKGNAETSTTATTTSNVVEKASSESNPGEGKDANTPAYFQHYLSAKDWELPESTKPKDPNHVPAWMRGTRRGGKRRAGRKSKTTAKAKAKATAKKDTKATEDAKTKATEDEEQVPTRDAADHNDNVTIGEEEEEKDKDESSGNTSEQSAATTANEKTDTDTKADGQGDDDGLPESLSQPLASGSSSLDMQDTEEGEQQQQQQQQQPNDDDEEQEEEQEGQGDAKKQQEDKTEERSSKHANVHHFFGKHMHMCMCACGGGGKRAWFRSFITNSLSRPVALLVATLPLHGSPENKGHQSGSEEGQTGSSSSSSSSSSNNKCHRQNHSTPTQSALGHRAGGQHSDGCCKGEAGLLAR